MVCLRKRVVPVFIQADPAKCRRSAQINPSGHIFAAEHVHHDFKMGVGMFHLRQMPLDLHVQINFFFDFSDAGGLCRFAVFNLTARKFP